MKGHGTVGDMPILKAKQKREKGREKRRQREGRRGERQQETGGR
jgi:hypothetical protein